ncbi:hypothetical protein SFR_4158 [Streptomyces sp. FR-008]|nr:hypothetical protein SFR_4158 [Streptomyces sp. FR-008]
MRAGGGGAGRVGHGGDCLRSGAGAGSGLADGVTRRASAGGGRRP